MKIGRHVSMTNYKQNLPVDCIQVFTKNPRTYYSTMEPQPQDFGGLEVVSHCGYLVHLKHGANSDSSRSLLHEAYRAALIGISRLVVHTSSALLADQVSCVESIVNFWPESVELLIENNCRDSWRLSADIAHELNCGICFDTCHAWAAGQPMSLWLTDCPVYHVNGSVYPLGSRRDRHASLREGTIPYVELTAFLRTVRDDALLILETPDGPGIRDELLQLKEDLA